MIGEGKRKGGVHTRVFFPFFLAFLFICPPEIIITPPPLSPSTRHDQNPRVSIGNVHSDRRAQPHLTCVLPGAGGRNGILFSLFISSLSFFTVGAAGKSWWECMAGGCGAGFDHFGMHDQVLQPDGNRDGGTVSWWRGFVARCKQVFTVVCVSVICVDVIHSVRSRVHARVCMC